MRNYKEQTSLATKPGTEGVKKRVLYSLSPHPHPKVEGLTCSAESETTYLLCYVLGLSIDDCD